jgi:hypothetical protein
MRGRLTPREGGKHENKTECSAVGLSDAGAKPAAVQCRHVVFHHPRQEQWRHEIKNLKVASGTETVEFFWKAEN